MIFNRFYTARWTLHRLHKWVGLIAALWLIVLGVTGLMLDHRDTWRWLWQSGVSGSWVKNDVVKKSKEGQIRLFQINPNNNQQYIAGGLSGLWWTGNAGKDWLKTRFIGIQHSLMISAVLFSSNNRVWIATDNGIWLSLNSGVSARQIILANQWVSAIAVNKHTQVITGVIDRTKIFKYSVKTKQLSFIDSKKIETESLPDEISLSRFIRDIHYGRGVFYIPISLLWNDISAIAMVVLPLTGFLFYWLPKRWRRNIHKKKKTSHKTKKQSIRWLFRFHGPTLGLISAIPLIYLSLSGVLLDHSKELRGWMKLIKVTQSWQTPVYNLDSWNGEIFSIVDDAKQPKKISIGTRLGLFTTTNDGQTWKREKLVANKALFVWTLRRHNDAVFIGGMGGPNLMKLGKPPWNVVKGVGHMPSDITLDTKSNGVWKSHHGLMTGGSTKKNLLQQVLLPGTQYVPWFYIVDGLHSGALIHSQWKWMNDLFAIMAIFLVITGLVRWWRKKWI